MKLQTKHTNARQYAESLAQYLNEIGKKEMNPLTLAQEVELFKEYEITKDPRIREKILKTNLRFVITIAKQFDYPKVKREDLVNEGNIGMIKCFDKYDYTKGYRFLTFASHYIKLEINTFIHSTAADIVQPTNRFRVEKIMTKVENILRKQGILEPTDEQMVDVYMKIKDPTELILTVPLFQEIKMNRKDFNSLNQTMNTKLMSDGEYTLGDTVKNSPEYDADHAIKMEDKKFELNQMLNKSLNALEIEIVEYTYGLNGREEKTLEQIADTINRTPKYTRARIGQLLQGALEKMRPHKGKVLELCGSASDSAQILTLQSSTITTVA